MVALCVATISQGSLEFQKASSCTGQISAYKKIVRAERKKALGGDMTDIT